MTVVRYTGYRPEEPHETLPYWSHIGFNDVKIKGRKVVKLKGIDEIHSVSIEQLGDEKDTLFWYSVHFHGFNVGEVAYILEIVATRNNKTISKQYSRVALRVVGHVFNGDIDLEEFKGDVPVTVPSPRVPKLDVFNLKDLPKKDTLDKAMQATTNKLAFLEGL